MTSNPSIFEQAIAGSHDYDLDIVFIKVPPKTEGFSAIQQLISEVINVNVTLLFGLRRYRQAAVACVAGTKARVAQGKSVQQVASVTSFLVSRIDGLVHPLVEKFMVQNSQEVELAQQARGQVAIARAKMGYRIYQQTFGSNRFRRLAVQGARVQRLLWASTGTENPDYSDVKYIEALIGADTVSTVPVETLDAYRDYGDPQVRIEEDGEQADRLLTRFTESDISLDAVTQQLEDEGVEKFSKPFDTLMEALLKRAHSSESL